MKYTNPDYRTIEMYLRRYPSLKDTLRDMQSTTITPNYSPMPSGNSVNRKTENLATRQLDKYEQDWLDSIDTALTLLKTTPYYDVTLQLVKRMYWMDYLATTNALYGGCHCEKLSVAAEKMGMNTIVAQAHKKRLFVLIWKERVNK